MCHVRVQIYNRREHAHRHSEVGRSANRWAHAKLRLHVPEWLLTIPSHNSLALGGSISLPAIIAVKVLVPHWGPRGTIFRTGACSTEREVSWALPPWPKRGGRLLGRQGTGCIVMGFSARVFALLLCGLCGGWAELASDGEAPAVRDPQLGGGGRGRLIFTLQGAIEGACSSCW